MIAQSPNFWWTPPSLLYYLLLPLGWIYGKFAAKRLERPSLSKINHPVLCLGNYTMGGCGKTPLAIAIAQEAFRQGHKVGFVTRGYGGTIKQLHLVDKDTDCARLVGDEPLLLAQTAPTMIGVNRFEAAKALEQQGCNFIIMDDGFQSRRLYYDYALLLVDSGRGFGNGGVFPAGPLRAPLALQLAYSSSVAFVGDNPKESAIRSVARAGKETAQVIFGSFASKDVRGKPLLAFCAIGNPDKFYHSVESLGAQLTDKRSYPDHHFYTVYDIKDLQETAKLKNLTLATTAKDYIRLARDVTLKKNLGIELFETLLKDLIIFDVVYHNDEFCSKIIQETVKNFSKRLSNKSS